MNRSLRIPIPCGGANELIDGRLDASYYPMTTGQNVVAALITARNGDFPRQRIMIDHPDYPLAVEIDRLVELHLEQFRTALLKTLKGETSKCELHVIRPTLQLCLELPDCDPCEFGSHDAAQAMGCAAVASTEKGEAKCRHEVQVVGSREEAEALSTSFRPELAEACKPEGRAK